MPRRPRYLPRLRSGGLVSRVLGRPCGWVGGVPGETLHCDPERVRHRRLGGCPIEFRVQIPNLSRGW
jgi:hypothetical protein